MMLSMDGRWDGWMDEWTGHVKKLHEKRPRHPLLYVIILHIFTLLVFNTI
jgi:hypothetical protein